MEINKLIARTNLLPLTYVTMLLVIFILPFYSFPEYSSIKNTASHLGAQHAPYSWIMNLTFFLLGFATIFDGWKVLGVYWFHKIVLLIFGLSLIGCAFFQHAPIIKQIPYNIQEDLWHSRFASLTGLSFTVFAIATSFILKGWFYKMLAVLIGIIATLLSILMFQVEDYAGVWQRLIFISAFGWLLFVFKTRKWIKQTNKKY